MNKVANTQQQAAPQQTAPQRQEAREAGENAAREFTQAMRPKTATKDGLKDGPKDSGKEMDANFVGMAAQMGEKGARPAAPRKEGGVTTEQPAGTVPGDEEKESLLHTNAFSLQRKPEGRQDAPKTGERLPEPAERPASDREKPAAAPERPLTGEKGPLTSPERSLTSEKRPVPNGENQAPRTERQAKTSERSPEDGPIMPRGEAVLASLGAPRETAPVAAPVAAETPRIDADMTAKLVDRILVSAADATGNAEVRISLREDVLPGTEIRIQRQADGGVTVQFVTNDVRAEQMLGGRQLGELQNILAQNLQVEVRVSTIRTDGSMSSDAGGSGQQGQQQGQGGGQDGQRDGRSRQHDLFEGLEQDQA